MIGTLKTGALRAALGSTLVAASLASTGCGSQYSDVGTVDVSASQAVAEKAGAGKATKGATPPASRLETSTRTRSR